MEMSPCPRKVGYEAFAAALLAAAWSFATAETGGDDDTTAGASWDGSIRYLNGTALSTAGSYPDGDSLFAQPPASLFPSQRGTADESSQWALSARHRHRAITTEFRLNLGELRDSHLQSPPATDAVMAMDRAENGMFFRRSASLAHMASEPGAFQRTEPQNKLDYIASHIARIRLSAAQTLPATLLWDKAVIRLDLGRQRLSNTPRSAGAFDPGAIRSNRAIQFLFSPSWSEVQPNLELSLPIALGYSSKAQEPLPGLERSYRGTRLTLGASAVYEKTWKADLRYMHYFQEPVYPMKARDFLWLSIQRSF